MDAQWIDEFHHSLRVTVGEEKKGYYTDFTGITDLAKSYTDAYVYDGQFSEVRHKLFGHKATTNPGQQFIVFSQNHDQVGNRKYGERSSKLYSYNTLKLMAGAVLLSPYVPLLFMGEEWAETNPFFYFVSYSEPDVTEAVRQGRKDEFSDMHADDGDVPDPATHGTFEQAKLQWNLTGQAEHQRLLHYYKTMIALRRQLPALHHLDRQRTEVMVCDGQQTIVLHRWYDEQHVLALMNFSKDDQLISLSITSDEKPWIKLLDTSDQQWGGNSDTAASSVPTIWTGLTQVVIPAETLVLYGQGHEKFHLSLPA